MMKMREITILGGGGEVGRMAVYVRFNKSGVLLDYGLGFGENDIPTLPLHVAPSSLKAIIISHAHLDHSGAAPIFYISSNIKSFMTKTTRDLLRIMYNDMLKISGYYLPFEVNEIRKMLKNVSIVEYNTSTNIDGAELEFYNAGHIPGSMITVIRANNRSLAFTGDVNTTLTRLVKPADPKPIEADTLVIESTYALVDHPPREEVERKFIEAVREVLENGGTVLVPSFSLSRGQEILSILNHYGIDYPIYYDGMIREINRILLANRDHLRDPTSLEKAISSAIEVKDWRDRRKALRQPSVIVSSAGMLKGGPAVFYLKKIANNPKNGLFLVSFQAPGTPGRRILEAGTISTDSKKMIKARVMWFDFSSHSGKSGLLEIIKSIKGLERVILVHGEIKSAENLAEITRNDLCLEAIVAENGQRITLD